jgi:uncharacterized protein with ATP-grasp and redox domains
MKMRADCLHCLIRRNLMEIREVDASRELEIMEACLIMLAEEFHDGVVSAEVATKVHEITYEMLGKDPYLKFKTRSNRQALALLPKARRYVEKSRDKFKAAVLCSIVGNTLDYGIKKELDEPGYFTKQFNSLIKEGLAVDDTKRMKQLLRRGGKVLYFTDNAGEIVFDQLLIQQIKENFDVELVLVVKGKAILSDATMEDVIALDLAKQVDKVIDTGGFAVGFPFWNMPGKLRHALDSADFIISKGMGNYECFSELDYLPIAYLMRTKCRPVAEALKVPFDRNVAVVVE